VAIFAARHVVKGPVRLDVAKRLAHQPRQTGQGPDLVDEQLGDLLGTYVQLDAAEIRAVGKAGMGPQTNCWPR
jgi:hypothetical protein